MATIMKRTTLLVAAVALAWSVPAQAELHRGRDMEGPRDHVHARWHFDPFWSSYPYGVYPYGVYPYGVYPYSVYPFNVYPYPLHPTADVRVQAVPKQAEVFVDGYYAGTADDFDGVFKRLHTTPGGHAITLYLEGYRTVTENVYVRPGSTFKLQDTMDKLPAGEVSAFPPPPAPPEPATQPPTGTPNHG